MPDKKFCAGGGQLNLQKVLGLFSVCEEDVLAVIQRITISRSVGIFGTFMSN